MTGPYKTILPLASQKLREAALDAFKATATEVANRIIDRTPVKTGRARANTLLQVNSLDFSTSDNVDPDGGTAKSNAASNAQALQLGDAAAIGNGLAYVALGLEFGTSTQAPNGMYGITHEEVPGIWEREFRGAIEHS